MSDENIKAVAAQAEGESEGRPFGYIAPEGETAMVCEQDAALRDKIVSDLKNMNYEVVAASSGREALKFMRFHIFSAIVVNEYFDTPAGGVNSILKYLEGFSMTIRRQIFVALVSADLKTMDNMLSYNKSVNLIINQKESENFAPIFKKALAENNIFYHVFRENLRKQGRI